MLKIFLTFVVLGFFSFGGGYTFLTLMESELLEKYHWLTKEQFILAITAGQISPGPVAVAGSFAGFMIGYNITHTFLGGLGYSFLAWVGTNVSTIVCMSCIMKIYKKICNHAMIPTIMEIVIPSVIGMIFYLSLKMATGGFNSKPQILIGIIAFIMALTNKIDYAFIIIGCGILGYFIV